MVFNNRTCCSHSEKCQLVQKIRYRWGFWVCYFCNFHYLHEKLCENLSDKRVDIFSSFHYFTDPHVLLSISLLLFLTWFDWKHFAVFNVGNVTYLLFEFTRSFLVKKRKLLQFRKAEHVSESVINGIHGTYTTT